MPPLPTLPPLIARDIQGDEARHGKAFEGLLNRYFGK